MSWRGSLRDIFRAGMAFSVKKYTVPETCFKIQCTSVILVYRWWVVEEDDRGDGIEKA